MNVVHTKQFKILFTITLILVISTPLFAVKPVVAQDTAYYDRSFSWDYEGKHWNWNLSIPVALYQAYKSVPDSTRTRNGPSGYSMMVTTQDTFLQSVAQKLNDSATDAGYSSYDEVNFVLAFVQSIPYKSDLNTTGYDEYPRFPVETLVDQAGDCDCKAILFGTLILMLGYGAVFINPPDHYAVAVLGSGLHGSYWEYPEGSNQTYYYAETTGEGFTLGQLPDEFVGKTAFVYPIDESAQYIPAVSVAFPTVPPAATSIPPTGSSAPVSTVDPNGGNPTIETPKPLSSVISDNPLLFIVILFAIVGSIALTIWSVRKSKHNNNSIPEPMPPAPPAIQEVSLQTELAENKFCIFCGVQNRDYAVYCAKCGKQIG